MITLDAFSVFLIGIYTYVFFSKKNICSKYLKVLSISLTVYLIVDVSMFASIAGLKIRAIEFTYYMTFIISFYRLHLDKIFRKYKNVFLILIFLIIINNVMIIVCPTKIPSVTLPNLWFDFFNNGQQYFPSINKYVLVYDIYILMTTTIIIGLVEYLNKKTLNYLQVYISDLIYVMLFVVLLEILVKNIFGVENYYSTRNLIFGLNVDSVGEIVRGQAVKHFGLMSEPAALAFSIFVMNSTTNLIVRDKKELIIKNLIFLFLGLCTGSLLFVVYFAICILQLVVEHLSGLKKLVNKYKKMIWLVIVITTIASGLLIYRSNLFDYFYERINNIIVLIRGGTLSYSSELVRISTSINMLEVFISKPLFGAGIATVYGFSAIATMLSNFGILLTVAFLLVFNLFLQLNKSNITSRTMFYIIIYIFVLLIQGTLNSILFLTILPLLFNIKTSKEGN